MPASYEPFDLREIAPQRWKNGAGLTREIAVSPIGASPDSFDWRISVAEVEQDAPFSVFPGIDRCIVLLRGAGMALHGADGKLVHRLDRRHEPFHFSGDMPLDATLLSGLSTDFNVMTRRDRFHAEVTQLDEEARLPESGAGLLLCSEGDWRIEDPAALELGPLQGLLWRNGRPALSVRPLRPDSESCPRLLVVHLFPHPPSTRTS
jgi:environmental stress-induced protein Ves